jgi:DNA mismatch repair ATPase MutL
MAHGNDKAAIENMLEQFKHFSHDLKYSRREKLLRSMALQQSIKAGVSLTAAEMKNLAESLFQCQVPNNARMGNQRICITVRMSWIKCLAGSLVTVFPELNQEFFH